MQSTFANALLDVDRPVPARLTSHTAKRPERRFAVYRNNVVASLIEALRAKFPATERIVGAELFRAMARLFAVALPPRSKILHAYGDDFGDFIAGFEPTADIVYLADVARLEAARTRAYHAADAGPLTAADFAEVDADIIGALQPGLHPSLELLRSRYPVVTIWSMNAGEMELGPIGDYSAEDALILRPQWDVVVRRLPPGGAAFIEALQQHRTLAEAAEHALSADTRFDLTGNLAGLIGSGAVTALAR